MNREGDKCRLYTDDPSSVFSSVFDYARTNNLKLITMNTLGPSLEDVFLRLAETGKQNFDLSFKDPLKTTNKQTNLCSPYQNINPLATDLPTFP